MKAMFMTEPSYIDKDIYTDAKIKYIQVQADEVKNIMKGAIDEIMKRDELLSEIEEKAELLGTSVLNFKKNTKKVKRRMWWRRTKRVLIITLTVLVVVGVIVLVVI
jgi:preprotein translocase subunit SecE